MEALLQDFNVRLLCSKCWAVAEMGDRLATMDMAENWGAVPLLGREPGPM